MSERDNTNLQELLAKSLHREKTGARWAYFAVHLLMAILFTAISWGLVLSGNEPLTAGAILLSLLAFFGCLMHFRNALVDSGMYQRSTSELLAQELLRRGIDLSDMPGEKRKRPSTVRLNDDGELATDDSDEDQPLTHRRTANNQLRN